MGHHELSIADIEFVGTEEYLLDDADVVLIEERRPLARSRAKTAPKATPRRRSAPLPSPYSRIFDDAQTRVFSREALR
ncbi:MAG TPA: hypothetical protein VG755_29580 [Nannocystaceae bacterium]|nr:hypothetical protein [Nannocystaceae bacterium]